MDVVCDVCGSMSNPQLMATCSECKEISEHIYCMLVLRVEMPEEWCCELCKQTCKAISSPVKDLSKKKSKVKFLPLDEVLRLTSGRTTTSRSNVFSDKFSDKKHTLVKSSALKVDSATKQITRGKFQRKLVSIYRDASSISTEACEVDIPNESEGSRTSMQQIGTHIEAITGLVTSSEVLWKGKLEILDVASIVYDGIQAHCPGKVSQKAFDSTKRLPVRIKMELLQRKTIWPEPFQLESPSYEDIAFYILPVGNTRPEYKILLENISSQDLGMRCHQNDVQLLLFSSKQLPLKSQKKNGDLYLWGFFRSIKGKSREIPPYMKRPTPKVLKGELHPFDAPPGFSEKSPTPKVLKELYPFDAPSGFSRLQTHALWKLEN